MDTVKQHPARPEEGLLHRVRGLIDQTGDGLEVFPLFVIELEKALRLVRELLSALGERNEALRKTGRFLRVSS